MSKNAESELEFRRGYYLAVANIMRLHDQAIVAEDVLSQYGNFDFSGIDPMDIKILKPIAAERLRKIEAGVQ